MDVSPDERRFDEAGFTAGSTSSSATSARDSDVAEERDAGWSRGARGDAGAGASFTLSGVASKLAHTCSVAG